MRQNSFFRKIGDAIAKFKTGDPTAKCYSWSDDNKEINLIKKRLEQAVLNGELTSKESDEILDECKQIRIERRVPGTTKTESILDVYHKRHPNTSL